LAIRDWLLAADAHDSWISKGGYRNPAGEWCCGATDCEAHEEIAMTGAGWVVDGTELIPYSEAAPSPDGKCRAGVRLRSIFHPMWQLCNISHDADMLLPSLRRG
jgi:hypothetical protein